MNVSLVGVNSKYVHTNLAIRKIKAYLNSKGLDAALCEYSGGEEVWRAAADILSARPDAVGFSCYIWNIEYVLKLAEIVKKADKTIKIILGGPEAQYNAARYLEYPFVDIICCGEGEKFFEKLMTEGIDEKIYVATPPEMDEMPFPYSEEDLFEKGRIFYYESSRGCPFSCAYCLSAAETHIKYRSLDKVFADLDEFSKHNVRLVKFVDRTFNSDLKRSKEILKYIINLPCDTEFHMEIAADIMDGEFIEILKTAPEGKIRLEAGLQSANERVLSICGRRSNLEKLSENIGRIINETKVTLHLDLIAGLPGESAKSFKNSFNFAYGLHPHELQLGFLKVLPGTPIEKMSEEYALVHEDKPPYEIISTADISFSELARLKNIELVLEYYLPESFGNALEILMKKYPTPYNFFDELAQYFEENGLNKTPHHKAKLYGFLYDFAGEEIKLALAKDFLVSNAGAHLPEWANPQIANIRKDKLYEIITDDSAISELPKLTKVPVRDRHKHIRVEKLQEMLWLISVPDKKIMDITAFFE
ncbi:MAG: DUF4080 domain-containing protein [Clostridia bacterium]|nr:DUF4080 domain-containing protein [Clostridia bacterium]